jgi:hypothetical protein
MDQNPVDFGQNPMTGNPSQLDAADFKRYMFNFRKVYSYIQRGLRETKLFEYYRINKSMIF